ncbi:MAG: hypothetical protein ACTFAL_15205 [Candidatus Electronema sp. V4]|uniref:hypothetical protein n=1 Tax=Candidatus Electronema sp. V4 TaxID=3454756 RepID=UPI00405589A9
MKASEFFVRKHDPQPGLCFVLMPFQEALTAVYEHGIKPQVESMGMQCKRADEIYSGQAILGDIWTSIQTAELIIVDCTGKNQNVIYEIGLCHALWKKVILLSQSLDDVPFDLRQWRVIWYDFTFAGAARLKEELGRAIAALRQEKCVEAELVELSMPQPEHCFSVEMVPAENAKVTFNPLPPLPNTKNKRASSIFIEWTKKGNQCCQGKWVRLCNDQRESWSEP